MRASRAIASAALGASAAFVALVHAQSIGDIVRRPVTWRAPAGCPDEESVNADVARLLAGSKAPVDATADVQRMGASWRVVVSMNGGVRRLEASSCRALAEATELIVAMAVDPVRVARNRVSQVGVADAGVSSPAMVDASAQGSLGSSEVGNADASVADSTLVDASPSVAVVAAPAASVAPPPADASASVDAAAPSPPPAAPTAPRDATFALSASGAIDLGTLPAPAVGASVAFAWTPWRFRFELSGAYFFPDSTRPAPGTLAVERFTMLTAAARACYLARVASFRLGPCLEAEVASVHGDGIVALPSSGSSSWIAPGAGLFGAWRFAPSWAILGRLDALIPTIRPEFQVDGVTLHQPGVVTGRLSLGAELRF